MKKIDTRQAKKILSGESSDKDTRSKRNEEGGDFGRVYKPFGKEEAEYKSVEDEDFDESHERCKSCAHWDGEGNCHIVPDARPEDYCEQYYADVGVFGHKHEGFVEENLALVGDKFDFSMRDIKEFTADVRERLESIIR